MTIRIFKCENKRAFTQLTIASQKRTSDFFKKTKQNIKKSKSKHESDSDNRRTVDDGLAHRDVYSDQQMSGMVTLTAGQQDFVTGPVEANGRSYRAPHGRKRATSAL